MTLVLALFAAGILLVWPRGSVGGERPHTGWLYVVDSKNGSADAQVLVVDPSSGEVVKSFKTGMNPDIALASDGKRLYVASTLTDGTSNKERLSVLDTATGAVLKTV